MSTGNVRQLIIFMTCERLIYTIIIVQCANDGSGRTQTATSLVVRRAARCRDARLHVTDVWRHRSTSDRSTVLAVSRCTVKREYRARCSSRQTGQRWRQCMASSFRSIRSRRASVEIEAQLRSDDASDNAGSRSGLDHETADSIRETVGLCMGSAIHVTAPRPEPVVVRSDLEFDRNLFVCGGFKCVTCDATARWTISGYRLTISLISQLTTYRAVTCSVATGQDSPASVTSPEWTGVRLPPAIRWINRSTMDMQLLLLSDNPPTDIRV